MTKFHTRYDRMADVLYLYTDRNAPAMACEDERGIVWRFRDNDEVVGATIIDYHELWGNRVQELARALAERFHVSTGSAARALASVDG